MPRRSLMIAGGLAASLILAALPAQAESNWDKDGKPVVNDVNSIAGASSPVLGSVVDSNELSSGQVGMPMGEGFSAEERELDETLSKPVFSLADRALAAKGEGSLQSRGVDTNTINQGMSLEGGGVGVGTLNASPAASSVMSSVNDLMSIGSLP